MDRQRSREEESRKRRNKESIKEEMNSNEYKIYKETEKGTQKNRERDQEWDT